MKPREQNGLEHKMGSQENTNPKIHEYLAHTTELETIWQETRNRTGFKYSSKEVGQIKVMTENTG